MGDAYIKAEMKKAVLELLSLTAEWESALDLAAAKIEAADPIRSGLKDLYERVSARSEELLAQLDRLQTSLNSARK
jgi:chromosome segregation ATPase